MYALLTVEVKGSAVNFYGCSGLHGKEAWS